jgi:hypothetical protein
VDPIFFFLSLFLCFFFPFYFLFLPSLHEVSLSARVVWYRSARGGAGWLAAAGGEKTDKEREREIERAK